MTMLTSKRICKNLLNKTLKIKNKKKISFQKVSHRLCNYLVITIIIFLSHFEHFALKNEEFVADNLAIRKSGKKRKEKKRKSSTKVKITKTNLCTKFPKK